MKRYYSPRIYFTDNNNPTDLTAGALPLGLLEQLEQLLERQDRPFCPKVSSAG
jgi:hypothetical protein